MSSTRPAPQAMPHSRYVPWLLGTSVALFVVLALPWPHIAADEPSSTDGGAVPSVSAPAPAPPSAAPVPSETASPVPAGDLVDAAVDAPAVAPGEGIGTPVEPSGPMGETRFDPALGRFVAPIGERRALLTIQPDLQKRLRRLLADYRVPWGATVLLEPSTGRVLAMAEHSKNEPNARDLSLRALAPAASIFKIVTSAALLEQGIEPDAEICYHGGKHRIQKRNLADDPRRDHRCLTLASALGRSANVVFAKLADRDLSADLLSATAQRFLFNVAIPFVRPVEVSRAEIPEDPFERATTAAGFGPVRLSPLHGALLAAIVANGGVFVPPQIVESVDGTPPRRGEPRRVIEENVAASLAEMMRTTVTEGTARRFFRDRRRSPLAEVTVAGKTGSLSEPNPFRDYSWFVGFAPIENPRVAVATVIVNERLWRVRAPYVAREALKEFFASDLASAQASLPHDSRSAAP